MYMTTGTPTSLDADPIKLRKQRGNGHAALDVDDLAAASPVGGTPRARAEADEETWWERWQLVIAAVSCWSLLAVAFLVDHLTAMPHAAIVALYVGAYLGGGTFAARAAIADLFHGRVNVDLLMVTAAIGAAIVDAWAEGAVLLGLFSTSNALEHHALGRTHRAVRALMELSPEVATVLRPELPGGEAVVPVEELRLDDVVLVRPGERVAVDGVVISGATACDQSAITGESLPVEKGTGDTVFAGTINTTGAIQVRVTKLAQESTLARIIGFVEEAREQKSRTQRFTDAFEGKYAVGVIAASALVAVVPWLFFDVGFGSSFYRAMTLLVVASPCALVISTPASTLSGLANAARHGILFKGGGYLEDAGLVQIVAFDKTGTLTEGRPRLTDVVPLDGWDDAELLRRAASAERLSEHPLGQAIVAAAGERGLALEEPRDFRAVPGMGIVAQLDGGEVAIGNEALFAELRASTNSVAAEIVDRLRAEGKTTMLVGDRQGVHGVLAVADVVRPGAAEAVRALKRLGIARTVMLTGDNRRVADAIAAQVGIDEVEAELLPEEKLATIRRLMADGPVAMVGDGVNDAPALATATLGVAMGAAGTDVALETADVVLMADDLTKLPYAIALSRRTRRTIVQNLTFSLSVIAVLVASALSIGIPLPLGVVGHEGSTIVVVLNGLRLLRTPTK
ncbi:MAG: Zn2+/Cd2+-exporting ATPase [Thermomicrobiales bacterium]|nr:Zn2+/Cd2+-exporting ATPase [Thermomicrobiales bacterium]